MEGLSGPQVAGTWRFRRLAVAAALLVAPLRRPPAQPGPAPVKLAATGIGMVGGALAMAAGFRIRANRRRGPGTIPRHDRRQRAWNLFALAGALAAVSNVLLISSAAAGPAGRPRAEHRVLGLALLAGAAGVAMLPAGPAPGDRPGPDGAGRGRPRRLGPVRAQRHRLPRLLTRGGRRPRSSAFSLARRRSPTSSSAPSPPCCSSARRRRTGRRSGWPPPASSATPCPTSRTRALQ